MKTTEVNTFLNSDWHTSTCEECRSSLECSVACRPSEALGETLVLCHDCAHAYDLAEYQRSGVMSGSSLPTTALMRKDFETYAPFHAAEVRLTPTMQALWAKYREHPTLNHPTKKQAILVDTSTGAVHSREWGLDSNVVFADKVAHSTVVVEIFDGMCGYFGIEIYSFGRANGMWVQGQVREQKGDAWYRSCHASLFFVDLVNGACRAHVGLPVGCEYVPHDPLPGHPLGQNAIVAVPPLWNVALACGSTVSTPLRAWHFAEQFTRKQISDSCGTPELAPGWLEDKELWPVQWTLVDQVKWS